MCPSNSHPANDAHCNAQAGRCTEGLGGPASGTLGVGVGRRLFAQGGARGARLRSRGCLGSAGTLGFRPAPAAPFLGHVAMSVLVLAALSVPVCSIPPLRLVPSSFWLDNAIQICSASNPCAASVLSVLAALNWAYSVPQVACIAANWASKFSFGFMGVGQQGFYRNRVIWA